MDLETTIRANLTESNPIGRPVGEYRMRVEQLADGVLALYIHPEGFNAQAVAYGITGNTLHETPAIDAELKARAEAREVERERIDTEHAAAVKAQWDRQATVDAEAKAAEEAAAAKLRPVAPAGADPLPP